jgi:hypothetical protein
MLYNMLQPHAGLVSEGGNLALAMVRERCLILLCLDMEKVVVFKENARKISPSSAHTRDLFQPIMRVNLGKGII